MSGGLRADDATLSETARLLRAGHNDVERAATPPPPAEAGQCSALVAGVTGLLCESLGVVSEGLDGAADAVARGRDVYADTDEHNATGFGGRLHPQN